MDPARCKAILNECVLSLVQMLDLGQGCKFQQENDLMHQNKSLKEWDRQKKFQVLQRPIQNPDLNSLEYPQETKVNRK